MSDAAIAERVREAIARKRMSRQQLAANARISLSTLEKGLAGQRPFTLSTLVRLEDALGIPLRNGAGAAEIDTLPPAVAPDRLGSYSRQAVQWMEGEYLVVRPSFRGEALFAYRTEIRWDEGCSHLVFRERDRVDADYAQSGDVSVPHQSGHIYLVTNSHGQYRLIVLSRPVITGEMFGLMSSLRTGRGSHLLPVATSIAFVPIDRLGGKADFGRIEPDHPLHAGLRAYLTQTLEEPFASFLS